MSRFLIRRVSSGVKFELTAANGQVIASSEVYTSDAACRRGIASVRKAALTQKWEDQTVPEWKALTNPKYEIFQDRAGQFRFRLKARNGEIIAVSEGYAAKGGCLKGIESVAENAPRAEIMEE